MRYLITFVSLSFVFLGSCKKKDITDRACFSDTANAGHILDEQAVIKLSGNTFYIYEHGTIDTRLIPCNLPQEFQINDLQVVISGYTKPSKESGNICCTEILLITKITR